MPLGRLGQRFVQLVKEADGAGAVTVRREEVVGQPGIEEGELAKGVHEPRAHEEGVAVLETLAAVSVPSEEVHERVVAPRQLVHVPGTSGERFEVDAAGGASEEDGGVADQAQLLE